jgi:RHH-type proline utilization regulon transcriptional repressor/proline dehydrogenase/delta 1-pyrroline-5-carboxylate dehydrogenase
VRWTGEPDGVMAQINALGYGLTLGIQTRIDSRAQRLAAAARVGNVYVNRNMVGAVVGVQPFGGEGLSGTGPKAGGPNYLRRFVTDAAASAPLAQGQATASAASGGASSPAAVEAALAELNQAHEAWADAPLAERLALLEQLVSTLAADARFTNAPAGGQLSSARALLRDAAAQLAEHPLPGPTGETNVLRHRGRGVFALWASPTSSTWFLPAVAAWASGNTIALAGAEGPAVQALLAALDRLQAGTRVPQALVRVLQTSIAQLAAQAPLAGVCVADAAAASLAQWAVAVAQRPGAILPIVSAAAAADARQIYRFCTEQTLTVNTAAAGGNAALLAGQH